MLEPYGRPRDIAYVIVTPENDYVMDHIKTFFKELSNVYEWSRLGRHQPVSDKIRDGMLRIGKAMAQKLADTEVDSWFKQIGDSPLAAKLRLYAQACRHNLGRIISNFNIEHHQKIVSKRHMQILFANLRNNDEKGLICQDFYSQRSQTKTTTAFIVCYSHYLVLSL